MIFQRTNSMSDTLVIQSHRSPLPYLWVEQCLASVRAWCALNDYQYLFIGDELFDRLPETIQRKTAQQPVITSDLARLLAIKAALQCYTCVVWLDADFLIFKPSEFEIPDMSYAVGREVWVQHDNNGRLRVYKKVHNAFLMFRRDNHFLDFYTESAQRLLMHNSVAVPP